MKVIRNDTVCDNLRRLGLMACRATFHLEDNEGHQK